MPAFEGALLPNFNDPRMSQEKKLKALSDAVVDLNDKFRFAVNNIDSGNFTGEYAEETFALEALRDKVYAMEAKLDEMSDYVTWRGTEGRVNPITGNPDIWNVTKWKSGLLEATYSSRATNNDPIPYYSRNGVYRSDPALMSYGVVFPYRMDISNAWFRPQITFHHLRTGFTFQTASYTREGLEGIWVCSPTVDPFNVVGTHFCHIIINITGYPETVT